jgi:RNA polymerase II transcription factor SIII (Elongin) subunit A
LQRQLEINSPQLIGRDGEVWLQFIKRDIPDWESKPHQPKDPRNWWKVYKKLTEQTKVDREKGAEKLKAALDAVKDEREQKLAKVVSRKDLPKEPINYKAKILYRHTLAQRTLASGQGKKGLLYKISKETHEARLLRTRGPTSHPQFKLTEVTEAPRGLIEEYKFTTLHNQKFNKPTAAKAPIPPRSSMPPLAVTMREKPVFDNSLNKPPVAKAPIPPRSSKPPLAITMRERPVMDNSLKEREDRLRALTGATPSKTTIAPDSSRKATNNQANRPAISPSTPKSTASLPQTTLNAKRTLSQFDGNAAAAVGDTPPAKRNKVVAASITSNQTRAEAIRPPQQRSGTPATLPRFSSPKRKAEPSVLMTAKRPRL